MILNSVGPCRAGSDILMVWQVAHCCLNSVAPSGGFAAGNGICADAAPNADIALQNPRLVASIERFVLMQPSLGRRDQAVVVAGCFMMEPYARLGVPRRLQL